MLVTLSWYVPPIGHGAYNLLVQRQTGVFPELDLTILPTPGSCNLLGTVGQHFESILSQDTSFSLKFAHEAVKANKACYPQPSV
jgi:hypothetical protein